MRDIEPDKKGLQNWRNIEDSWIPFGVDLDLAGQNSLAGRRFVSGAHDPAYSGCQELLVEAVVRSLVISSVVRLNRGEKL